ncbi:DUF1624 domain-containing protein [Dyella marensis]|uniref:acyltransferase family protein n=1 Tax=Dyella marensis TaxID=500610 RepID=UPI0031D14D4C
MTPASPHRLASVDALRGCTVAAMLLVNDPGDWGHVYWPLEHAQWHGCTPTDLVFPFFLFVVGVSVALAIAPRMEQGADRGVLLRAAMVRALRIVGLGLLINAAAALILPDAHMRIPGVLQRIGICFGAVAAFQLYANARVQWGAIVLLLVGYAALLVFGGTLEPFHNVVSRADTAVFGHYAYRYFPATGLGHDPEGLLGTLPSIATTLLGLRAGHGLRGNDRRALLLSGTAYVLLGALWALLLPLNKNLWTPSFVLWAAGWATLALLVFHVVVDLRGWPAWGRRFGVNAVAAYAGSEFMQILLPGLGIQDPLYRTVFGGWITPLAGPYVASLAYAMVFVAVWWVIVWAMDRRRVYLKL